MQYLPPLLMNKRINVQINLFFSRMASFYKSRRWVWEDPKVSKDYWVNKDYELRVIKRYDDGAYNVLKYIINNLPSYSKKPSKVEDLSAISYTHKILIYIPREYPASLVDIRFKLETPLFHPRVSPFGSLRNICYVVMGEIDRVLEDLIFFLLLKPDRVRPPALYPKEDYGLNREAMLWYQRNYKKVINFLETLWNKRHEKEPLSVEKIREKKREGGIVFIE